ncbi:MAG: hypothetical protein JSR39_08630 [Verrucomicrobia bacterium]|nr:hypothetical protein [Verrucomicrobiota bacterium]
MSASGSELKCAAFEGAFDVGYYSGFKGSGKQVNPKDSQARSIINLSPLVGFARNDSGVKKVLNDLGFKPEALDNIYSHLGGGNKEDGKDRLLDLIRDGKVTIERIGFSKEKEGHPAEAKFYMIINEVKDEGGNNQFHIGFSRKGAVRGITREVNKASNVPELAKKLSSNETFHDHVERRCSRIMNDEPGIKVSQLGKCNLWDLDLSKLTKSQRFRLYISIFEGLNVIHKLGVHQDVKPGNIVVDDENHAMFIDFDTLKETNEETPRFSGTLTYFSPERLRKFINATPIEASKKDDIWAAMLSICELEAQLPESERLLSEEFVQRYEEYSSTIKNLDMPDYLKRLKFVGSSGNLFEGLKADCRYPLDALVYETAHTIPAYRYTARDVLMHFSQLEVVDSKENIDPEVNRKKSFFSRFFG